MARDDDLEQSEKPARGFSPGLVLGVVLGAGLALFVVQNTQRTRVEWLFLDAEQPLWVVLLVTGAVSALVIELVGGARRRRKRKGS